MMPSSGSRVRLCGSMAHGRTVLRLKNSPGGGQAQTGQFAKGGGGRTELFCA